jgi:ABC-type Fe3+/spermidine/putrescine transport system ATPase subunit
MMMADTVAVVRGGKLEQVGRPRDVYSSPESMFVAEFLGGANIIQGEVVERHPDGTSTVLLFSLRHKVVGAAMSMAKVNVAVRQEDIELVPEGKATHAVPAKVDVVQFMGTQTRYVLLVGNAETMLAVAQGPPRWAPEQRVALRIPSTSFMVRDE